MDFNNNENSSLENSNDTPNNNYTENNSNDYNNGVYNNAELDDSFNNNFNNNFNNDYNNNFNNPNNNLPNPNNGYAVASLVLGIVSIPLACCYGLGIITAIIGIVMAFLAKKNNNRIMPGMAIAGIICSVLGIVFSAFSIAYYIYLFSNFDFSDPSSLMRQLEGNSNFY